jgi:hypothetical protein
MKPLTLTLLLCCTAFSVFSQDYLYNFKISEVGSLAEAKEITVFLRPLFNLEDEPNTFFPTFNSEQNDFEFRSIVLVSKEELDKLLFAHGKKLLYYYRLP